MDNIILGLLLLSPRTIYDLQKRINQGLNLMYSCSTGSIQAALKKLLGNGFITATEKKENGRIKKIYSITAEGEKHFLSWLVSPMDATSAKNPELAKIYFLGFAKRQDRIALINKHIEDLTVLRNALDVICNEGEKVFAEKPDCGIMAFQYKSAVYGRDFMDFNIKWYKNLLEFTKGYEDARN